MPADPDKFAFVRFVIVLLAAFIVLFVTVYTPFGVMYKLERLGISCITSGRKYGGPEPVGGPANTVFPNCEARVIVIVPDVVIGEPLVTNIDGAENPTLVTVPPPPKPPLPPPPRLIPAFLIIIGI